MARRKKCRWVDASTFRCICEGGQQGHACLKVQEDYYRQFVVAAGTPGDRTYRFFEAGDLLSRLKRE